jgi:hypothetical protein
MSEINVRRKQGQVVMILSDDYNTGVEVALDAAEASKLAALLLEHSLDRKAPQLIFDPVKMRANARPFQ